MFLGEGWRGIAKTGDQCALKRVQVAATPLALCREISRDFFVTGRGDGGDWLVTAKGDAVRALSWSAAGGF